MPQKELPKLSDRALADFDSNGMIDDKDWQIWLAQLGQLGLSPASNQILSVIRENSPDMKNRIADVISLVESRIRDIPDPEIELLSIATLHLGFDPFGFHIKDSLWRNVLEAQSK